MIKYTIRVIRSCKSKRDRQYNLAIRKINKKTNNGQQNKSQKTKDWAT
jgi:hypothetical protein